MIPPTAKQPCFGLRFRAYGKRRYITLGRLEDGWTRLRAERELAVVLREVELGTWQPSQPDPVPQAPQEEDVYFLEFSEDWLDAKVLELAPETARSYRNDLRKHLIPFFKDHLVGAIDIKEVDRYRQHKVREGAVCQAAIDAGRPLMVEIVDKRGRRYQRVKESLSARSINMHIDLLQQILELAVEYDLLLRNPAVGKRRRLKVTKPRPVYLDSAEHIAVMLEAAADLDERDSRLVCVHDPRGWTYTQRRHNQTSGRKAAIAVLMLAGPRATAGGALLERDLDLANGRIAVARDKTEAGTREIDTLPLLREILVEHRTQKLREGQPSGPDDPVLINAIGRARDRYNLGDVVAAVVRRADELQAQRDRQPLPLGITPHKLRHTFASILVALGKDPNYVMEQLGHTDPAFTLRVYTHMMRRSDAERKQRANQRSARKLSQALAHLNRKPDIG
ncbi:MAG TPA: tyrosine-type recombinase/integrase [Solirubrobacteraceae bacterium]|nr:tyrosine-type recombinase/integrase [Solirubrobacteraceae bacterium]